MFIEDFPLYQSEKNTIPKRKNGEYTPEGKSILSFTSTTQEALEEEAFGEEAHVFFEESTQPTTQPETERLKVTPERILVEGRFTATPDFRHIQWKGEEFLLAKAPARVIAYLFLRWQEGSPYASIEDIQRHVGFRTKSLAGLFRNHKAAFESLLTRRGRDLFALRMDG
jgi:hypothetical protein